MLTSEMGPMLSTCMVTLTTTGLPPKLGLKLASYSLTSCSSNCDISSVRSLPFTVPGKLRKRENNKGYKG